jgi:hypothetical protein
MPAWNWIAPRTAWTVLGNPAANLFAAVLHDAAAAFRDRWGDSICEERGQLGMRNRFVIVHQPRIASHVGRNFADNLRSTRLIDASALRYLTHPRGRQMCKR